MKMVNYIERNNFCWNDFLTKSNRTEIQTYKVEERAFGTPRTTGSRGDVFVVRTSKPVENFWKNGLF